MKRGIYVSRDHMTRDACADLLLEAAYLVKQPDNLARAWAIVAAGLAMLKMAELDPNESVREIADRILRDRQGLTPSPDGAKDTP